MQRIVEAPFARLFPSRLEPTELLGKLERAMEDNLVLAGEGRLLAPIIYDIYISIKDHQQLDQSFNLLKNDWQRHLIEFAKQPHRHYILKANPLLRLPQAGQQVYQIEKPVINIGRQLSNDIIVEDKRVSRYHAQIKYQSNGQFAIFDLGSTNGITINGVVNQRQHTLRSGDRFTIGNYDFYFERR